jgi:SHS family lactate transporter-like MFS transporter
MAESHDKTAVGHVEAPEEYRPHTLGTCAQYLKERLPTLKPPMRKAPNPFKALALLNRQQWLFFSVCLPANSIFVQYLIMTGRFLGLDP